MIDPKSTAGILLREHDDMEQAARYAVRKAHMLAASGHPMSLDYQEAAKQLQANLTRQQASRSER